MRQAISPRLAMSSLCITGRPFSAKGDGATNKGGRRGAAFKAPGLEDIFRFVACIVKIGGVNRLTQLKSVDLVANRYPLKINYYTFIMSHPSLAPPILFGPASAVGTEEGSDRPSKAGERHNVRVISLRHDNSRVLSAILSS